jgi:hypothetical protein
MYAKDFQTGAHGLEREGAKEMEPRLWPTVGTVRRAGGPRVAITPARELWGAAAWARSMHRSLRWALAEQSGVGSGPCAPRPRWGRGGGVGGVGDDTVTEPAAGTLVGWVPSTGRAARFTVRAGCAPPELDGREEYSPPLLWFFILGLPNFG